MKIIGLIGGMSWESSLVYYKLLNEEVRRRCGGHRSAELVLYSVDFAQIEALQRADRWDDAADVLVAAAERVVKAGAELLVLCTNTMHRVAPAIEARVPIPLLHIVDTTATAARARGLHTLGLTGTRFTMEQPFYRERMESQGVRLVIPDAAQRATIHRIIYDELCQGVVRDDSRAALTAVVHDLTARGAQGVILGCTELGLILRDGRDGEVPLLDSTALHAVAAIEQALTPRSHPLRAE